MTAASTSPMPRTNNLSQEVELVVRGMSCSGARVEGLSVELYWRDGGGQECLRVCYDLRQWYELVKLCGRAEALERPAASNPATDPEPPEADEPVGGDDPEPPLIQQMLQVP